MPFLHICQGEIPVGNSASLMKIILQLPEIKNKKNKKASER